MTERTARLTRRITAGAAMVAVPLAGMQLYLKHQAAVAAAPKPIEDSTDEALAKLRNVDPKLIGYREIARFPAGVTGPRAVAVEGTHTFVSGFNAVKVFGDGDARGIVLSDTPNCLAVKDGTIYVGFNDHVEVYDLAGKRTGAWATLPAGALVTGIAVGASDVYLADSGRRVVVHTDHSGKVLNEIGRADPSRDIPGILLPSPHLNVAVAADGTVWLNNAGRHRMENYSPDGTLERFWGAYGMNVESFIGCCNPSDFALLSDGSFVTAEKGVLRVKHYLSDGRFESFIAPPTAFAPEVTGLKIAAGSDGRIIVIDRGDGTVHVFAPAGGGR
jgi:hypothetical protein